MYPSHRSKLLFTDTDSLTYLIQVENSYQDMYLDKDFLGFSDIIERVPTLIGRMKTLIHKIKFEMDGDLIKEFVLLKTKRYSILTAKIVKAMKTSEI